MKSSNTKISRRNFIPSAAAATTAGAVFPQILPRRIVGVIVSTPDHTHANQSLRSVYREGWTLQVTRQQWRIE